MAGRLKIAGVPEMTDKIKELRAVLDMPEVEQNKKVAELFPDSLYGRFFLPEFGNAYKFFLADLAFRLRDEVIADDDKSEIDSWWCEASYDVFLYVIGEENERDEIGLDTWFSMRAQPIHWIIAALIAKELAKDGKAHKTK